VVVDSVEMDPRVLDEPGDEARVRVALRHRRDDAASSVVVAAGAVPEGWTGGNPVSVEVPAGEIATVDLTITAGDSAGGGVEVTVVLADQVVATGHAEAYLRGRGCSADPTAEACLPSDFDLMYNFEGTTEGWSAGTNVASVASVGSMANGPRTPRLGQGALEAMPAGRLPAEEWRTVSVTLDEPAEIDTANAFVYHLNGYGGASGATGYESRIVLTSSTGEHLDQVSSVAADQWNRVEVDLRGWPGRDVASIAVSFRARSSALWEPRFQVDYVGLDAAPPVPAPATNLASGAPVTARVDLSCCGWGRQLATDGQRISTSSSKGYTSDPWRTTPEAVEWLAVDLGSPQLIGEVWVFPRTALAGEPIDTGGANFPADFRIQVSDDGQDWTTVREVADQASDGGRGRGYEIDPVQARHVRVYVTRLGRPAPDEAARGYYRLQVAEIEVHPPASAR
jgi:hypothetical protein